MRPVFALLISLLLIGGVSSYIKFAESVRRPPIEINIDYAQGEYSITLERTFDCLPDEIFAPESLRVMFKGETVFAKTEVIPADQEIEIEDLPGVEVGENEIFISANRDENAKGLGVLKAIIKRNDIPVVEKMLFSEAGFSEVSGPVVFVVSSSEPPTEKHDH